MSSAPLGSTAVVTVSYNSGAHLHGFLASIQSQESPDLLVVVADNGSTDRAAVRIACDEFSATMLELDQNYGYGGAINRAVATLPDSITRILVSNPDVKFGGAAISRMAEYLDEFSHVGAVGPRVFDVDGQVYPSARELPSLRTGIGHALFGRVWPGNPWTARYHSNITASPTAQRAGWLSGSCLLIRRTAFEAVHGFDDAFFMYFEDVDLGYRLGKAGWESVFLPDATVIHVGAHSTSGESSRMIRAHHTSAYRYLSQKYSAWYLVPLRLSLRFGLAVRERWLTAR